MEQIKFFNKEDKNKIIEFNKLVHGKGIDILINNMMFKNPYVSLKDFAYIDDNGKIAAMVGLLHHKQRFGNTEADAGEIAIVGTHPDYRNRGLCTRLINYWTDYMRKNKIPLSFLFGIADFYQQFGYEYAVPVHWYSYVNINKELLKDINGYYRVEKLEISEKMAAEQYEIIAEIKAIYDYGSRNNFCSKIRSARYFEYRVKSTCFGVHSWYIVKKSKEVKGYFWVTEDEESFIIREANILDEEAGKSFCKFIYEKTKDKERINDIGMRAPLNNSFSRLLYKYGGSFKCNNEIFMGSWAGMYKIVDLKLAMEILKENFEERLKQSRFYNFTGNYRVMTETAEVIISINKGSIDVIGQTEYSEGNKISGKSKDIKIPANILTSVYTGYRNIAYYKNKLKFEDINDFQLFNTLFPIEYPYIWDLEMSDELK